MVCPGLFLSYWGSKLTALRRAQKPSALGDEVTVAINLLVRLLPLVQMILMYHLYFPVRLTLPHPAPQSIALYVTESVSARACYMWHTLPLVIHNLQLLELIPLHVQLLYVALLLAIRHTDAFAYARESKHHFLAHVDCRRAGQSNVRLIVLLVNSRQIEVQGATCTMHISSCLTREVIMQVPCQVCKRHKTFCAE